MPFHQFLYLHTQLVDTPEQTISGVIFYHLSHPEQGSEGIHFLTTSGIFQQEVVSSGIKLNYNIIICGKNLIYSDVQVLSYFLSKHKSYQNYSHTTPGAHQ